ncbi:MAG: sigma-70 family RNA polymerase sigma factor [Ginsengibacter sp.]
MDAALNVNISRQFHIWYESFQNIFMKMGLKFGYQQDEIKDMINQFFLDLLEKEIDPSTIQNPEAYLSTAFRRKLIDHYRKHGKERLVVIKADYEHDAGLSIQDTIEKIESNTALIQAIQKAYRKLPARCRKVIDLKYYEGLNTEQIVAQTGLTKRSVYNNLFEGIKLLREELNHTSPGVRIAALLSCLILVITIVC